VLACDHNTLTSLPPSLSSLAKLERLNAGSNRLTDVSVLKALSNLKQLNLSHNSLAALPASVADSTALQELDVSNNSLQVRWADDVNPHGQGCEWNVSVPAAPMTLAAFHVWQAVHLRWLCRVTRTARRGHALVLGSGLLGC